MTLISVIIPVFNGAETIAETIASVRAQTYPDFELIVINDGSTDATVDIVEAIAKEESRIRLYSYSNAGLSKTRNRGIEKARGEFISIIDADDLWTEDKLEDQLQALQENPEAGLAYSFVDWIDESDQFKRYGSHIKANGYVLEQLLLRNFIDNGSNVLIRKSVIEKVGMFKEELTNAADWDMWLRIAALYEFACVPKVQVYYRVLSNSLSSNLTGMASCVLTILDAFFAEHPNLEKKLGKQAYADKYRFFTFKSIEGRPNRKNGVLALKFFVKAVFLEPDWWMKRTKLIFLVLAKGCLYALMPPRRRPA